MMDRYEYMTTTIHHGDVEYLNKYASQGWRVIQSSMQIESDGFSERAIWRLLLERKIK